MPSIGTAIGAITRAPILAILLVVSVWDIARLVLRRVSGKQVPADSTGATNGGAGGAAGGAGGAGSSNDLASRSIVAVHVPEGADAAIILKLLKEEVRKVEDRVSFREMDTNGAVPGGGTVLGLSAPLEALATHAASMKLEVAQKQKYWSRMRLASLFAGRSADQFLSSGDAIRVLVGLLHSIPVPTPTPETQAVIQKLAAPENSCLLEALTSAALISWFPLHDDRERAVLSDKWVRSWSVQPIHDIRSYLGEQIAMYFAFLGTYCSTLCLPACLGLYCFFWPEDSSMHASWRGPYTILVVVWATIVVEIWKRKQISLAYEWNVMEFHETEEQPPEFERSKENPDVWVPRVTSKEWFMRLMVSVPAIGVALAVSIVTLLACEFLQEYMRLISAEVATLKDNPALDVSFGADILKVVPAAALPVVSLIPTIVYGTAVASLNMAFRGIAMKLTELESHDTEAQFRNSYLLKLILFETFTNFISFAVLAFVLQDFDRLRTRLVTVLIVNQAVGNIMEAWLPSLRPRIRYLGSALLSLWQSTVAPSIRMSHPAQSVKQAAASISTSLSQQSERFNALAPEIAQAALERYGERTPLKSGGTFKDQTFTDLLELYVQFGHIVLFACAFPLAPVCALVNNIIEVRSDAFKILSLQRAELHRCGSLGIWVSAFNAMGYIAVVTNLTALGFATDWFVQYMPTVSLQYRILACVVVEHVVLLAKWLLMDLIPDAPAHIRLYIQRQKQLGQRTIPREKFKSL